MGSKTREGRLTKLRMLLSKKSNKLKAFVDKGGERKVIKMTLKKRERGGILNDKIKKQLYFRDKLSYPITK